MSNDVLRRSYDQVPYDSRAVPQSHPDRLNVLGRLMGLRPAPVEACRVLEFGCASGGNLLPMAAQLPDSRFTGIDLSPTQIAAGTADIEGLALANIELHVGDVTDPDLSDQLGRFDYVIAHGLYSWVPNMVRQMLLPAIARLLAPDGLAYVSYNTFPGWQQRGVVRRFLQTATAGIDAPDARAAAAREAFDLLSSHHLGDAAYGALLAGEQRRIAGYDDRFLLHDLLEAENHPVWFADFARHAGDAGLRFVCESNLTASTIDNYAPAVRAALARIDDAVEREQQIDFWVNRTLRESVLCHADRPMTPALDWSALTAMWAGTPLRHETAADPRDGIEVFYVGGEAPDGSAGHVRIGLRAAGAKLALDAMIAAAPASLGVTPLCDAVGQPGAVLDLLAALYTRNLLDLSPRPPAFVARPGDRPATDALVRWQLRSGQTVTNRRHQQVTVDDPVAAALLPCLDGRHTQAELHALVRDDAVDVDAGSDSNGQVLNHTLNALALRALLVA